MQFGSEFLALRGDQNISRRVAEAQSFLIGRIGFVGRGGGEVVRGLGNLSDQSLRLCDSARELDWIGLDVSRQSSPRLRPVDAVAEAQSFFDWKDWFCWKGAGGRR